MPNKTTIRITVSIKTTNENEGFAEHSYNIKESNILNNQKQVWRNMLKTFEDVAEEAAMLYCEMNEQKLRKGKV